MSARDPMSDYARDLLAVMHAVNRATQWGFCRICKVAVPKPYLAVQNGCCATHKDEPEGSRGCAECGHPHGHYRDCGSVE